MQYTNNSAVSLPLAVWLVADGYDFRPMGRSISVTSLLKPVRQILLKERLTKEDMDVPDVLDNLPSRRGHALHDSVEKTWLHSYADGMKRLGYPQKIIDRLEINPPLQDDYGDTLPVFIEQRQEREFLGYTISGKLDLSINGELHDMKSTSVFSWIKGDKDEDYRLQGSMYAWLHRQRVWKPNMFIQFIFTDWQRAMARQQPDKYPQQGVEQKLIELMPHKEVEDWLTKRFKTLEEFADAPENELPHCTDKELWREAPMWKYFSDPAKAGVPGARSSKNFDTAHEAFAHRSSKGKGAVLEVPGKVKACSWCPVFNICSQKDLYEHG